MTKPCPDDLAAFKHEPADYEQPVEAVTVEPCDELAAEAAASAANIVTCDGYYEIDIDALAQAFARHRTQANETMLEALRPLQAEIDRLGREYGFDRPDEQYQPLMLSMRDVKRIAALSGDSA